MGWELLGASMSSARAGCGAGIAADGRLFVAGGSRDGAAMLDSCECLDPRAGTGWRPLPALPSRRGYLSAAFALDERFYVAGGTDCQGTPLRTVTRFDTRMEVWEQLPDMLVGRADCGVAFVLR